MIGDAQLWLGTGGQEQVRGGSWVANTKQWRVKIWLISFERDGKWKRKSILIISIFIL